MSAQESSSVRTRREKLTLLFPNQDRVVYCPLNDTTMHDLGLDQIIQKVTADPKEQAMLTQVMRNISPDPAERMKKSAAMSVLSYMLFGPSSDFLQCFLQKFHSFIL